jgi:putative transposase
MARAGVVPHPEQWPDCNYVEIQHSKARYGIVDNERLMELMGVSKLEQLQQASRSGFRPEQLQRQSQRSESLAVGCPAYLETFRKQLGPRAKGRDVLSAATGCQLREEEAAYGGFFEGKKGHLSFENSRLGDLSHLPQAT